MDSLYTTGDALSASSAPGGGFRCADLYACAIQKRSEGALCSRFHLENESGTGDIAVYHAFPGIELAYNDMHMEYCSQRQAPRPGVIEINYCREGRCECAFAEQSYCYMAAGDLSVCSLQRGPHTSSFPTAHYHGVTVTISLAGITEEAKKLLAFLSIDIAQVAAFAKDRDFYIARADEGVRHIFSELYTVPESIRPSYSRIKLMELLLLLTQLDPAAGQTDRVYFSKAQRDCVRQIHDFVVEHIAERYTIEELAQRFQISPTAMKSCFKGVYGVPVYSYFRTYRLQVAERLLREGQLSVAEIAAKIGYANPNKFSSAFRSEYGVPPTVYKKNV